ncbi:MAG: DUF3604 domain-containing protein [Candidatus Neomarinimicrobiota bacterium]
MLPIITLILVLLFTGCTEQPAAPNLTPQKSLSVLGIRDLKITTSPLCEYPDIHVAADGVVTIVYTAMIDDRERILLLQYQQERLIDSLQVSSATGFEYRPRLCGAENGGVWVVWSAKRDGNWDIYARRYSDRTLSAEYRISGAPTVDIRPAVCRFNRDQILIVWESESDGQTDLLAARLDADGASLPEAVTNTPEMELRPVLQQTRDGEVFLAWDRQAGDGYQVFVRQLTRNGWEPEIQVSPSAGFNLTPALASRRPGQVTIAWKTNLQPAGKIGLTPWINYRHLDRGRLSPVFTPAGPADWDKSGEDQGFEFPTLTYDNADRLWIFGRPSQGFLAQVVDDGLKSVLYNFDVPGWGGRGQYVRAVSDAAGRIHSVRRDIRAIYYSVIDPNAAMPELIGRVEQLPVVEYASPVLPLPDSRLRLPDSLNLLWGDIHLHSSLSDGMGTADEVLTKSRRIYRHDFAALTDHEWFVGNQILPSEWEFIKFVGRMLDELGQFAVLPAFEWTTARLPKGFGHKNVYFNDWEQSIFSYRSDARTTSQLFDSLAGKPALTVPHHIGWTGIDWDNPDPVIQPVMELVSGHGAFEYQGNLPLMHRGGMPGNFIQDGLARGLKFGFIGSSDSHGLRYHHGMSPKEDSRAGGLAAVLTGGRDRAAVFAALQARSCYATSGTRIEIKLLIDGRWPGSDFATTTPPEIQFEVVGSAPLKMVELVRNNQVLRVVGKDLHEGRGARSTFVDQDIPAGTNWYYLRVIQENNEMAWSSPIWVDYSPAGDR